MRIESTYSVQPGYSRYDRSAQSSDTQKTGADEKPSGAEQTRNQSPAGKTDSGQTELTAEEQKQVEELKKADREIKQHEMAHMAAAAGISISGASFEYKRGPDGVMYAVAGEVSIDTSPVPGDPKATLDKAQKIERAALAPAEPSPQDRKVAAQARQMATKARMEMMQQSQTAMGDADDSQGSFQGPYEQGSYIDVTA